MSTRTAHIRHTATAFCMLALSPLLLPAAGQSVADGTSADIEVDYYRMPLEILRPLAEQGDAQAQFVLALRYISADGVLEDVAEAVKWYRLAAEQGHLRAQHNLANEYARYRSTYAEAVKWYRLAAAQGLGLSQRALAEMYFNGHGVLQDYVMAHMWINVAHTNEPSGLKNAMRDFITEQMSPAQIAEAQRRARVCLESNYQDCD